MMWDSVLAELSSEKHAPQDPTVEPLDAEADVKANGSHKTDMLKQAKSHLYSILEHLPEGVCLLDRNWRPALVNPEAKEILRSIGRHG